jgi:hypothetical protein
MLENPFQSISPDEFAELVAESLINTGTYGTQLKFDRQQFALFVKDAHGQPLRQIALKRLYYEYCCSDQFSKEQILLRALGNATGATAQSEALQAKMLPFVRDRWSVEKMRLDALVSETNFDASTGAFPHKTIAEHFAFIIALNTSDGMVCLTPEHLRDTGLTFEQAWQRSIENVRHSGKVQFQTLAHADTEDVVLHSAPTRAGLDVARALLLHQVDTLPVCGDHLLFLVNRNNMLVTGSTSERGLMYAYSELRAAQKQTQAMPPFPIMVKAGEFAGYRVPETSLWRHFFRDMELRYLCNTYTHQKELLAQPRFASLTSGMPLLSFELAKNDNGKLFSYCDVIDRSMPMLLPKTDFVYFHNASGRAAAASFDTVVQAVPELLTKTEFYPQRLMLPKFPDSEQLRRIGLGEASGQV